MKEAGCNRFARRATDCSIYLHVPFCSQKCRYCAFYSVIADAETQRRYLYAVQDEWRLYGSPRSFSTIYVGGGSPTAMNQTLLLELLDWLTPLAAPDAEITLEVNPGQTDAALLTELRRRGVNRISIGAQSFHDDTLGLLGRIHSAAHIERCFKDARDAGFDNIGLDLIFAVPGTTISDWMDSLHKAIGLDPAHISAYSLTYEGDTPLVRSVNTGQVTPIDEDLDYAMYEQAIETLESAGFVHYEVSNFARPGYECRHNLRYWQNLSYLGLGPAAASCCYGKRMENRADLAMYLRSIENGHFAYESERRLEPAVIACETAVLNLRMRAGINPAAFEQQTGFELMHLFAEPMNEHLSKKNLEWHNGNLRLTREAMAVADRVVCDFAAVP